MTAKTRVFEERRTTIERGAFKEYIRLRREEIWPEINRRGGDVICLLSGLVGQTAQELVEVTRFPGFSAWREVQAVLAGQCGSLVEREEVRLLRQITPRPVDSQPDDQARPMYVVRQFFVKPGDVEEFAELSLNGVWPRYDAHETNILGLWTPLTTTETQEIILITGYHSLAHWEESRVGQVKPDDFDQALWDRGGEAVVRRQQITLSTRAVMTRPVCVMGRMMV